MKLVALFKSRVQRSDYTARTLISSLYERIRAIRDPKVSISPLLNQWIEEGQTVDKPQLQSIVRALKNFRRFHHALEVSQWMTDSRYFHLTTTDVTMRLDLIFMVHGQEQAEHYFDTIPKQLKLSSTYGVLLSIYARGKSLEKAEDTMQRMREMGFATSSFPYNMLINLYSQTGNHEKIVGLIQEMQMQGIPCDSFTRNNLMAAYVERSDISAMEELLNSMEEDPNIYVNWDTYSIAVNGYLKVGLIDKALEMIKKMEGCTPVLEKHNLFNFLLSLYARAGHKNELYRVWDQYKASNNRPQAYSCMITSLARLDDIEGAEKIYQEWDHEQPMSDLRVLNSLLSAYCQRSLFDKAESLVNQVVMQGRIPYASTWNILAKGYVENKRMPKAVETFKKALLVGREGWKPDSIVLEACLEYLEGQGDVEDFEEITKLCENTGIPVGNIPLRLLALKMSKRRSSPLEQVKS